MIESDDPAQTGHTRRMIAAMCGFVAVALGAFGAHALRSTLAGLATVDTWNTASLYHLVHSAVLLCIALARPRARLSFWLILAGIVLFTLLSASAASEHSVLDPVAISVGCTVICVVGVVLGLLGC